MPETPESLRVEEFRALRATIRERGSVRQIVTLITFSAWAAAILTTSAFLPFTLFCLVPLTVLAAGFETTFALHTGVERIGRYIHVHYESASGHDGPPTAGAPKWERIAARFAGPAGGVSPLMPALFIAAGLLNLTLGVFTGLDADGSVLAQGLGDVAPIGALHAGFLVRVVVAHRFAATQRERDQREFERLLGE